MTGVEGGGGPGAMTKSKQVRKFLPIGLGRGVGGEKNQHGMKGANAFSNSKELECTGSRVCEKGMTENEFLQPSGNPAFSIRSAQHRGTICFFRGKQKKSGSR